MSAIAEPRARARGGIFEPIPPIPFPSLWRTDTRSIVGSVLLAVAFSANMQITERLDTATVGGIIPWTAIPFGIMWFTTACFFFGMTGGLIVASFNPIIAILDLEHRETRETHGGARVIEQIVPLRLDAGNRRETKPIVVQKRALERRKPLSNAGALASEIFANDLDRPIDTKLVLL